MRQKTTITSMLCLILLLASLGPFAAAEMRAENGQVHETALSSEHISLTENQATRSFHFQLEDYWRVDTAEIVLIYHATPLSEEDTSSVTLSMNGTYFHSFRPVAGDAGKQRLTIPVPAALFIDGYNTLTIEGHVRTSLEHVPCVPHHMPDRWLQIYKESSLLIRYESEPVDGSIRDFYRHFAGMDTAANRLRAVAAPAQGDAAELEAALYALSGLAKANRLHEESIPLIDFDDSRLRSKSYVVAVALYERLPDTLKSLLGGPVPGDQAWIQLVKENGRQTLVITSADPALLAKAGRLVANQELMMQLSDGKKVVRGDTETNTPVSNLSQAMHLTETGDTLKGIHHQEITYFVALPANRAIADASKISLDMRYARNLDFNRSMVTVRINDIPIGSKKLTAEMANGDSLTLNIPRNLNISGNFSVTVAFDLELINDGCMLTPDEMPWAHVSKDSLMQIHTKDNSSLLFDHYPNLFLRDGAFNHVAVVLPQQFDSYTYSALANVFNLLGKYAESNTGDIRVYTDQEPEEQWKARNIIAIGTYHSNRVIREHNDKLYFRFRPDGNGYMSNEKVSIDSDYGSRIGAIQLIESPYEAGRGLLVIAGASPAYYELASTLIENESARWKIYGDGAIVDKDGNIRAYRFKKQAAPQVSTRLEDVLERKDVLGFLAAALSVAVLVLISLILLIRKYRKMRRERNES